MKFCILSVSPEIVAAREDFFNHGWTRINTDEDRLSLIRVHPCSSVVGTYWLRLGRAALYRRFLTCQMSPASNVLPITNRRYGRLKICATLNRYPADQPGWQLPAPLSCASRAAEALGGTPRAATETVALPFSIASFRLSWIRLCIPRLHVR